MNRTEGERLVERYMSGAMTGAEEQEFFIQVATDSNLRHTLKAYRIVDTAIQKHRDALPAQHTAARSRLTGMLSLPPHGPAVPAGTNVAGKAGRYATAIAFVRQWRALIVASVSIALLGFALMGLPGGDPTPKGAGRGSAGDLHEPASPGAGESNLPKLTPSATMPSNPKENGEGRKLMQVEREALEAVPRHQGAAGSGRQPLSAPREFHGSSAASERTATRQPDVESPTEQSLKSASRRGTDQEAPREIPQHLAPRISARDTIKIRVKIALPRDQ
jgi:hypothetical protein